MARDDQINHQNIAGGIDGRIRLIDTRLELSGFYSSTSRLNQDHATALDMAETSDLSGIELSESLNDTLGHSAGMNISWRGQNFRPRLGYLWIDQKFDPVMGFVYRTDIHAINSNFLYYFFRPQKNIRSAKLSLSASHDRSSDWNRDLGLSSSAVASICHTMNICLESGWSWTEDEVRNAFDLAGMARIQAKIYQSHSTYVTLSSPSGKRLELSANYTRNNGYFDGHLDQFRLS